MDPEPDANNKMSRLQVTAKERDALIDRLDKALGKRVIQQTKARAALEAIASDL